MPKPRRWATAKDRGRRLKQGALSLAPATVTFGIGTLIGEVAGI